MSHIRNYSEVDLRPNSAYKLKSRNLNDVKRNVFPLKITKESPYKVQSITKTRSISSFKTKLLAKHRSNSPSLSKQTSNNSSMVNITTYESASNQSQRSISESYRQLYKEYPPKINYSYKNSQETRQNSAVADTTQIEEKIKSLSKLDLQNAIQEYFKLFDDIIEKDLIYGKFLKKIKENIDE